MVASTFGRSGGRILAIAGKEVLHIRRDPRTLYLALAMPVVMLVLFGFGISFDVDHLELAVVDQDGTWASRELVRQFTASKEFVVSTESPSPEQALRDARRGHVVAVLVLPKGFARAVSSGGAQVQLLVDGADGNTATQVLAKAQALIQVASPRLAGEGAPLPAPPVEVRIRTLFNPGGRSALFVVPGLAAYLLAIVAVLMTALTVAREWERGSMEQLFATPVGRMEIVVGKLLPYLCIGLAQVLLVLTAGAWVFSVPIRGSLPVLGLGALLFLIGMLGQGLLISVVTRNQVVATQVATLTSMLPSMLLSGFIFPISNLPAPLRLLSTLIPARYFVSVLRGVLLRGNGLEVLWPQLGALALFALLILAAAMARFQRRLD
ncbi:ABC transporter permease [Corallococcus sp. H22C18031201]|uniref:ABC transporter permease n=1 Tax=Citreicoccus inhibens TaxID=2849499 RepID=UPI000E7248DD|nr:ABC transporter permease [Citreicoccus inhibens]MBU8894708.1 ABC transporter permease [Citreicoccus inhibens]RJS25282.1 ABC transporter permease [Corallococcus sp. H22C18031201]